jgi:hypothetical protein
MGAFNITDSARRLVTEAVITELESDWKASVLV